MSPRLKLSWLLPLIFLLTPSHYLALSEADSDPNTWKAKYVSGTKWVSRGQKFVLTIEGDMIKCSGKKGDTFEIPIGGLQTLVWDHKAHHYSVDWVRTMSPAMTSLPGLVFVGIGTLFLAPFHSTDHFLHVGWIENDRNELVIFKMTADNRRNLAWALGSRGGPRIEDFPAKRRQWKQAVKDYGAKSIQFNLTRSLWVGETLLRPGLHSFAVVIENNGSTGRLYLARGKHLKWGNLLGIAAVRIEEMPSTVTGVELGVTGVSMLSSLTYGNQRVTLLSAQPDESICPP